MKTKTSLTSNAIKPLMLAMMAAIAVAGPLHADPYTPISPIIVPPDDGLPHPGIPVPYVVPGKEYSNELDTSSTATTGGVGVVLDDQQNTMWNGISGIADTFDYNGANGTSGNSNDQVDALANVQDAFFQQAIENRAAILFSTRIQPNTAALPNTQGEGVDAGAPTRGCAAGDPICSESIGGAIATWATWPQVDQNWHNPVADPNQLLKNLDGLEVWGPEGSDDANRFSLFNDAAMGCSIWAYDGVNPNTCYVTQAEIAGLFPTIASNLIDIDALMVNDRFGSLSTFDVGDMLMFSLWPIAGAAGFDVGDAVYVYTEGGGVTHLNHGGHLWTNNWLGLNVDALEAAAPEPASLALLAIGFAGMASTRRRKSAATL